MNVLRRIKEIIFGIDLISVEDFKRVLDQTLDKADADSNGMLSVDEVIGICKRVIKDVRMMR